MKIWMISFILFIACSVYGNEKKYISKNQITITEYGIIINAPEGVYVTDSVVFLGDGKYMISSNIRDCPKYTPDPEKNKK